MSFGVIHYAVFNKANGIKFLYYYSRFALAVSCKILVLRAEVAYLPDTLHVQLPCAVEGILIRDSSPSSI